MASIDTKVTDARECMNPRQAEANKVLDSLGIDYANAAVGIQKYLTNGGRLSHDTLVLLADRGLVPLPRELAKIERSNVGYGL